MRLPALRQNFIASTTDPAALGRLLGEMWAYLRASITPFIESPRATTNVIDKTLVYAVDGGGDPIPVVINHLLPIQAGRTPEGWCVTDKNQPIDVYRAAWDDKTISLVPNGSDVTIRFEVW